MTRRLAAGLLVLTVLAFGSGLQLFAHEGHDHKVMGTVTMAAADHVMLKDTDGRDVMIHVTKATKIKAKQVMKVEEIKPGTRVVVTAEMEKDQMMAKEIQVGAEVRAAAK